MAGRGIDEASVKRELGRFNANPIQDKEREVATRSLVRFARAGVPLQGSEEGTICAREEWVRLYVALRRAGGDSVERLTSVALRSWRTRVQMETTVKRKCFLIKKAELDQLPEYPADLDRWVIPAGDLELPADIYEQDILIVDDGYDRRKLDLPGVLHVELCAKWTREYPSSSAAPPMLPQLPAAPAAVGARLPLTDAAASHKVPAAPAVQNVKAGRAAGRGLKRRATDGSSPSDGEAENPMEQIIQNTFKAKGLQRWSSADKSQPNTVEFWFRIYTNSVTSKPATESTLQCDQVEYLKYLTKILFESTDGFQHLPFVATHLTTLQRGQDDDALGRSSG